MTEDTEPIDTQPAAAPPREAPHQDAAPQQAAPQPAAPHQAAAPPQAAPQPAAADTQPVDTFPQDAAPKDTAPNDAAPNEAARNEAARNGAAPKPAPPTSQALQPVLQLRLVVEAADYDAAVRFYRDGLGLTEEESFGGEGEERGMVLDAGRATLELHNPAQRKLVDELETDGRESGHIRVAFEVTDTADKTLQLTKTGAPLIASPRLTPWQSLNSRLEAPDGLTVTLFQESASPEGQAAGEQRAAPEKPVPPAQQAEAGEPTPTTAEATGPADQRPQTPEPPD